MAKAFIVNKTYTNPDTGEITPYKRLAISGEIGGKTHTLELKLTKAELLSLEMILSTTENNRVVTRPSTEEETDEFLTKNSGRSDGKLNLEEDD